MTAERIPLKEISSRVEELHRLASDIYKDSGNFPAVNRNAKRILASIEMLRIDLEQVSSE